MPEIPRPLKLFKSFTELYEAVNKAYPSRETLVGVHISTAHAVIADFTKLLEENERLKMNSNENKEIQVLASYQPDPITIGDLKKISSSFPDDVVICTQGYEGGFNPLHSMKLQELLKNVNSEYYYGPHDCVTSVYNPADYEKELFLIFQRNRGG